MEQTFTADTCVPLSEEKKKPTTFFSDISLQK